MRTSSALAAPLAFALLVNCSATTTDTASQPAPDAGADEQIVPLPSRMQAIVASLAPLLECPTRIWGADTWEGRSILFVSAAKQEAYLWNDPARKTSTSTVAYDELPARLHEDFFFDFVEFRGALTLAVSLDFTADVPAIVYADLAASLAVHEGFHLWAQASWPIYAGHEGETNRDPDYPEVWQLRLRRLQVHKALLASLRGAPLGHVAHWRQTLRAEHASAVDGLAHVDAIEGSASYAEAMTLILGKLGCAADDRAVLEELVANETTFFPDDVDASTEPYQIGLASLSLLRRDGGAERAAKVESGTPPLDVLLEGVAPIAQPEDAAFAETVRKKVEAQNASAAEWIEPLLTRLDDPANVRIVVPGDWVQGGFALGGSFRLVQSPERPTAMRVTAAKLKGPTSDVAIALKSADMIEGLSSPCGARTDWTWVIPIPPEGITLGDGERKLTATAKAITTTDLPVVVKTDAAGRRWICAGG